MKNLSKLIAILLLGICSHAQAQTFAVGQPDYDGAIIVSIGDQAPVSYRQRIVTRTPRSVLPRRTVQRATQRMVYPMFRGLRAATVPQAPVCSGPNCPY